MLKDFFRSFGRVEAEAGPLSGIVLSVPPSHRLDFARRVGTVAATHDVVSELFRTAQRQIHVFSPYVDPTFTALLQQTRARVRIVTTARECRGLRPNPVLERCAGLGDFQARYVVEHQNKAQIFQMHAKMVLADAAAAYVGSANLTDTSLHFNFEMGMLTREPRDVAALEEIFDHVWNHMSVTARML